MNDPFYVLVCGGRDFRNKGLLNDTLHSIMTNLSIYDSEKSRLVIVHGNARGADKLAGEWAAYWDCPVFAIPAQWNKLGKQLAGSHRNAQMLKWVNVSHVVAFPGGSGTSNMVSLAKKAGIPVTQVFEDF